jgi:hypothetical protein
LENYFPLIDCPVSVIVEPAEQKPMARKKKFNKIKAVKDAARATVGEPRPTQVIPPDKKRREGRGAKHKKPPEAEGWEPDAR